MTTYTDEEVTAFQAERWGTTIEAVRAMNPMENLHHAMYGSEPGLCPVAEHVLPIAQASLRERQTIFFDAVCRMPPQDVLHLIMWGAEPCPEIPLLDDSYVLPDRTDPRPVKATAAEHVNEKAAAWMHCSVYGQRNGFCATASRIRPFALAAHTERQTVYIETYHEMTPAEKLHLILWDADACPDVPKLID